MNIFSKLFNALNIAICCLICGQVAAQLKTGIYKATEKSGDQVLTHKLTIDESYLVHSVYGESPAKFVLTRGGFYEESSGEIYVQLEFNSQFESDGIKELTMAYKQLSGEKWAVGKDGLEYERTDGANQDLDGNWLFATRGPDTGQERRDDSNARKTLKMLGNGSFQWIAYNTESFKFFGSGGGSYTAENGLYTEKIEFFSRDDSRVGAELQFNYELKGNDWHHTGKNSRGEPMYEIWSRR